MYFQRSEMGQQMTNKCVWYVLTVKNKYRTSTSDDKEVTIHKFLPNVSNFKTRKDGGNSTCFMKQDNRQQKTEFIKRGEIQTIALLSLQVPSGKHILNPRKRKPRRARLLH